MAQLDRYPAKGRVYRFRNLLYWAQGGCVCMERMDENGKFNVVQRKEFINRIVAIRDSLNMGHFRFADEREQMINFVLNACAVVKECRKQGDPFDPRVLADQIRARKLQKGYIYLGDGSVLFTDLCTKEQAMATPDELRGQQQGAQAQNQ